LYSQPRLVEMATDSEGRPAWLRWRGRRERVRVHNAWRVEGAWWQGQPAGRAYYTLLTASQAALVEFLDEADGRRYVERVVD
jgi:hypothetical protein